MAERRSRLTPEFTYSDESGRYRGSGGRYVSPVKVREALDGAIGTAGKQVKALADGLRAGSVSLADFQLAMAREMKSAHLASAALAKGGWAEMSAADYGRLGPALKGQYVYLRAFTEQIESGKQRMDGTLARRAQMYIQAGRATYHQIEQREQKARGMTEERNVLHARDSCNGCLEETARGWVPMGELVPVGMRECRVNCLCSVDYRQTEGVS